MAREANANVAAYVIRSMSTALVSARVTTDRSLASFFMESLPAVLLPPGTRDDHSAVGVCLGPRRGSHRARPSRHDVPPLEIDRI
jgi:hypothetical protein